MADNISGDTHEEARQSIYLTREAGKGGDKAAKEGVQQPCLL